MRYFILNLVVSLIIISFMLAIRRDTNSNKRLLCILIILLVLTAIFDSLIVYNDIVGYNTEYILGIYIGKAPIEDFFYAVVAALLAPVLWDYYEKK